MKRDKKIGQGFDQCERNRPHCKESKTDAEEYYNCCTAKEDRKRTEMEEIWNKKQTLEEPNACDHACPRNNPYEYYVCCVKVLTERRK